MILEGRLPWIAYWGPLEFEPEEPHQWLIAKPLYKAVIEQLTERLSGSQ